MKKTDILIFMSDQHTPYYSSFYGNNVDTPNLDALCLDGTRFDEAYTSCPLCVPARMSMLSGQRAAKTGIFTNADTLADLTPTFLHHLVEAGYETVLAGRMHFVGQDQRHGFTKRIAPDMTPVTWNRPVSKLKNERGVHQRNFLGTFASDVVGGGESPVLQYDEMVIDSILNYLSEPHDKPQCIIVGTYGPHFPYVAPKELYMKYQDRVNIPNTFYDKPYKEIPFLKNKYQANLTEEMALACQTAYCGMIENMDRQIGQVRQAFNEFVQKRGSKQVFCYLSDHGDHAGDRRMLGKMTFFEKSSKIPLIIAGDKIQKNKIIKESVSIMDIGPTMLDLAGSNPMPNIDGVSLYNYLHRSDYTLTRPVVSEFLEKDELDNYCYSIMIKQGPWKWICYHGYENHEMLFNTLDDPDEQNNLIEKEKNIADQLRTYAGNISNPNLYEQEQKYHKYRTELLKQYEIAIEYNEKERWQDNPESAKVLPEISIPKNERG